MDQSVARVLSIILALGVVIGVVWFVQQDERRLEELVASHADTKRAAMPQAAARHGDVARIPVPVERNHKIIYTCSNNGQTTISDRPCGNVIATHRAPAATEQVRVRSYREQYDNLVAQRSPAPQTRSAPSALEAQERERIRLKERCAEVHRRIASIDARARQRHSSREADRLREQRRLLSDEGAKVCR